MAPRPGMAYDWHDGRPPSPGRSAAGLVWLGFILAPIIDAFGRGGQGARPAVIQVHFERFRRNKAPGPHDQFGAACFVVVQMQFDFAVDHVALSLAHLCHVGRDRPGDHRAELGCVMRLMRDPGAPNLVLARQASDVGTGTADPPALDDGGPPPRLRQMPSQ